MTLLEDTARLDELRRILTDLDSVVVAFSGGADSAFLAWVANDTLGPDRATAVTAVSPSVAGDELDDCRLFADEWGFDWRTVTGDATVVLGVNLDDHRPGQRAATERGARFPLVDAGFDKAAILSWSQRLGLRTWDKPAAACLASRLPYGTKVRLETLSSIERAECSLRRLGFGALRVRHYDDIARIEVPIDDLEAVMAARERVVAAVKSAGYRYVTVDLGGLRSGNLNHGVR